MSETRTLEPYVDVATAAAFLSRKPSWLLDRYLELGIPSYKAGQGLRFKLSEVDAWAREQAVQPLGAKRR